MTVSLQPRAPRVRCYKCGSSDVRALCHHCWRPVCAKHVFVPVQWAQRLFGAEGEGPATWACQGTRRARDTLSLQVDDEAPRGLTEQV